MSRVESEQRAIRAGLASYLGIMGWTGLSFSEGWGEINIENPLINIYILEDEKINLEMGRSSSTHKLFSRIAQVDCYMESESRVRAVCEDVMDYLDSVNGEITDILTTSGLGYYSFPDSEKIESIFMPPELNDPEILRWRGVVRGSYEAYYPNGGNPL